MKMNLWGDGMTGEKKMATRDAYGKALVELGEKYKDIVVLDADLSESTRTRWFGEKYPERFFNVGIAEQNMIGIAAGLATCGKIPFVSTFAVFATGRAYNQIRQSIAYPNLNVKIVASHGGISVGADGVSHHCTEDVAVMRVLPNFTVIVPADAVETKETIKAVVEHKGPVYVRLGRPPVPVIFDEDYSYKGRKLKFEIGKAVTLEDGEDVTVVANGIMVYFALKAKEQLEKEGVSVRVIDMHTVKPVDVETLEKAARETGAIVTAEEHSVIGGLGGAVAETLVQVYPVPMELVGIKDVFAESAHSGDELLKKYGCTDKDIVKAVKRVLERKKT